MKIKLEPVSRIYSCLEGFRDRPVKLRFGPIKTSKQTIQWNVFCVAAIYSDVNRCDGEVMGKDKKKKGKGKEKTAEKTEKKLKSKVLKKTGEVSLTNGLASHNNSSLNIGNGPSSS